MAERLVRAHRDLFTAEARIADTLSGTGTHIVHSLIDQWPVLEEYLHLYAGSLSPAGVLILAGRPDAGSVLTGIPFTGPREARRLLGLRGVGDDRSPAADAFWGAVARAQERLQGAPLEGLFANVLLSHAIPFAVPGHPPALFDASARHLRALLAHTRPQLVATIGADALGMLGHAIGSEALEDLARVDEAAWLTQWPPERPMSRYPSADADNARFRVVPLPSLTGPHAAGAIRGLERLLDYAWV